MKHRVRWMLIGLGLTFGLQSVIGLLASLFFFSGSPTSSPQGVAAALVFGLIIGTFLVGGFVVGLMNEKNRLVDASAVALLTLTLGGIVFAFSSGVGDRFYFTASWLSDPSGKLSITAGSVIYVALTLIAAATGAYIGYRVRVPGDRQFDRIAALAGLLGAVVGPFVLFSIGGDDGTAGSNQRFPWYFLVIILLLVLVIMGIGFLMFTRETHEAEDISISPPKDELVTGEK